MTWRLASSTACGLIVAATLAAGGAAQARPARPPQRAPVVVEVQGDGFHWGDAAVGAAATLGLTLAAGGVVVFTRTTNSRPEGKDHA